MPTLELLSAMYQRYEDSATSENSVKANFAEFTFRNCLENRNESQFGTPKATNRGEEDWIVRLLAPKTHGQEAFSYFPNSFSTHSGE
jgi:hypothetical protein